MTCSGLQAYHPYTNKMPLPGESLMFPMIRYYIVWEDSTCIPTPKYKASVG